MPADCVDHHAVSISLIGGDPGVMADAGGVDPDRVEPCDHPVGVVLRDVEIAVTPHMRVAVDDRCVLHKGSVCGGHSWTPSSSRRRFSPAIRDFSCSGIAAVATW